MFAFKAKPLFASIKVFAEVTSVHIKLTKKPQHSLRTEIHACLHSKCVNSVFVWLRALNKIYLTLLSVDVYMQCNMRSALGQCTLVLTLSRSKDDIDDIDIVLQIQVNVQHRIVK